MEEIIFWMEDAADSGVKKIADKVAGDVELVTDRRPRVLYGTSQEELADVAERAETVIVPATVGKSRLLEQMEEEKRIGLEQIRGKRECYGWFFLNDPEWHGTQILLIAGSDKRGTIYGLFHLSELLGVSPFVDWCGIRPPHREHVGLRASMACVAGEPSVRYRGFFINDEWPAFGTWCNRRFGGFGTSVYEHVFELLLRLKGNYLWPAMWSARFGDDGPGLANAKLADEYGIIMGMSHHEPCLRQGEEYKYLRGKDSVYGDAWNFRTNREGIIRFWKDGLLRRGKFENVITLGMRGEADTAILGEKATLEDNIELLRDVLKTQNELIRECVDEDVKRVPRMLALYKEVEAFFYGNDQTAGLMGSEELEDVILLLCDDNYGNLRTLPTKEMRTHKGGYGMYYHLDYHGWPISYEWINSSYLPKIWEQMTTAYEFGVRELWIVNVGDIATQEFPLSYFLDMAYDFGRWGSGAVNQTAEYTRQWTRQQFGSFTEEIQEQIADVLQGYTRLIQKRRPEAMRAMVYHPVHGRETQDTLEEIKRILTEAERVYAWVKEHAPEYEAAFVALIYYPAAGTLNLTRMHLLAGMNQYLAKLGALHANDYGDAVEQCLKCDRELVTAYHQMDHGRWNGMGASEHIGFVHWNEDECLNPVIHRVLPADKPRLVVTVDQTMQHAEGSPWLTESMKLPDFLDPACRSAGITLYGLSECEAAYEVTEKPEWLSVWPMQGVLDGKKHNYEKLELVINRERWAMNRDGNTGTSACGVLEIKTPSGCCRIDIPVCENLPEVQEGTFVDTAGYIVMEAEHYADRKDGYAADGKREGKNEKVRFQCIRDYGKTRSAMKAFPVTAYGVPGENAPYLEYHFWVSKPGGYVLTLYMQPSNPVANDQKLCYGVQNNGGEIRIYNAVPEGYRIGDQGEFWAKGVLDQIRRQEIPVSCRSGINRLRIYSVTPGFVLEKLLIRPEGTDVPESYLGPKETYHT